MSKSIYIEKNTELVEACKLGSRSAQYKLYNLYAKAMFNVSLRIVNHRGEAEDVLQEAFIDAFAKIGTFRQEASFGVWLKQIVVNKAISTLRKKKLEFLDIENEAYRIENENFTETEFPSESPETNCDYRVEAINKGMKMLPEGYRVVLSLYLFEGYDHEEISDVLGISVSTSRTQFMRGKMRLTEVLKDLL
ncbi:MAG: RNA polymerase sigma factor [Spirosomaceae bacterium]|nr:RNA polymerase sigma factor [Spirosomataceae bacterium]